MRGKGLRFGRNNGEGPAVEPGDQDDRPGYTRTFTVPEMPAAPDAEEHVTTYRAGQPHPEVGSARLPWRELLRGIYRQPTRTFAQMRYHQVWAPALTISALYGLLATLGIGSTRDQVFNSTFGSAVTILLSSAVGFVLAGTMLGSVTHVLARRLGGDGAWAPTVGLSLLVCWTTDAPRLVLALFLPSGSVVVQLLGWATWGLCAWLLSAMLRQVHDVPWGKAAAAAAPQLIVLLVLIKLPTLG